MSRGSRVEKMFIRIGQYVCTQDIYVVSVCMIYTYISHMLVQVPFLPPTTTDSGAFHACQTRVERVSLTLQKEGCAEARMSTKLPESRANLANRQGLL
jgi:hypothetical protein